MVRLAGREALTGRRGNAKLTRKFKRPGRRRATASRSGYRPAEEVDPRRRGLTETCDSSAAPLPYIPRMARLFALALLIAAVATTTASAHLERPSYWPDPAPDNSVSPPAGGKVPKARSLASAVTGRGPGEVRVVCQKRSLAKALASIRRARKQGFRLRPSQPVTRYSKKKARKMRRINRALKRQCEYRSIQAAVNASGNNDRVVIMPGRYMEPKSRKAPINDKRCNPELLQNDASGDTTPSYAYQVTCPNDQNLIYVQGRAVKGEPLETPRADRQGIPEQELGECVRCNLQIEGSGPKPEDVIIDAGEDYEGTGPEARPNGHAKHVVMRVDRADGFVGRNWLTRGGLEFGFYVEETDGVLLDRTKFFWNADYGHLSFTTDHNLIQNCDGMGAGDAAHLPGRRAGDGRRRRRTSIPTRRASTRRSRSATCATRRSATPGSMGNAVRITNNHIYGNTTGIASDTLSSGGHPGLPGGQRADRQQLHLLEQLLRLRRRLTRRAAGRGSDRRGRHLGRPERRAGQGQLVLRQLALRPLPAGGAGRAHERRRRGGRRSIRASPARVRRITGSRPPAATASPGTRWARCRPASSSRRSSTQFDVPHGTINGSAPLPNGVDFWWDEFSGNTGNCWFDNTGFDGSAGSCHRLRRRRLDARRAAEPAA